MIGTLRELSKRREQRAPKAAPRVDIDVPAGVGFRSAMKRKEQSQVVSAGERSHGGVAIVLKGPKAPFEDDPNSADSA